MAVDLAVAVMASAFFVAVTMGFASLASAWSLLRGMKPNRVVLAGTLGAGLFFFAIFILQRDQFTASIQQDRVQFEKLQEEQSKALLADSLSKPEIANKLAAEKEWFENYFFNAWPSWVLVTCSGAGFVAYYLAAFILSRITKKVSKPMAFQKWILPDYLVFGLIAGLGLKVYVAWLKGDPSLGTLGNNLMVFFTVLYVLGGLVVMAFFLDRWKLPRAFQLFIFLAILFFQYQFFFTIGVMDVWLDFRKLKTIPPPERIA